ncbi:DUF3644 domain-containing protein [Salinivibrio kushneri]|uniref:DUF3644 domain-containing protein n=1 Tax=Salinivibrio kushneri TaxID=1908198 RepID=UPI0022B3E2BA|nr:DUF3644 domain-containing protein [Salinivibrio kushneri]WBA12015.1 DUF3644 domain-containing protein [Salinivibrio kushneri]
MKSRARTMLDKSIAAMLSAIEIYNKPDFNYRAETFSVLCINSWELLFKAKVLQLARNQVTSLYVWEHRQLKTGKKSKKRYIKTNRAGNPMSVSLFEAHRIIIEDYGVKVNKAVKTNIAALTEIRDNSIHFINDDLTLAIKVQEIGTASLQNYLHLVQEWFGPVLDKYNFYLMPMAFFRGFDSVNGETLNASEKKILEYIDSIEKEYDDESLSDYNLSLRIDVNFKKVKSGSGVPIQITNDAKAPVVRLAEEEIMDKYPWDYDVLTTRLKKRYSDFKANADYHRIRKSHEDNEKYCHKRLYNPSNPDSGSKVFFNPNILKEFDKHYTKKS